MISLLVAAIVLLVLDTIATTALLIVVCRRAGYKIPLWPEKKPDYYA